MNNQGDIKKQWIDRETYQKIFWTSHKYGAVIDQKVDLSGETNSFHREDQKRKAIIISGFYNPNENSFVVPKIRLRRTALKTPSFYPRTQNTKLPTLFFQLWREKSLLKEIKRPILKMEMELFYENGRSEKRPFNFSPLRAVFDLPEGVERDKLRLVVLNPQKKRIYATKIPKKKKKKRKKSQKREITQKSMDKKQK